MSTLTLTRPPTGSITVSGHHVRLYQQVRAEWVKVRSVRSTWVCLALIVLIGVGLGVLISFVTASAWAGSGSMQDRLQYDPVRTAQAGMLVSQFVVGVIGVLAISSEYSSGLIRTTLSSVSHRISVLVAKVLVLSGLLLGAGEATAIISSFVSRAVLLSHGGVAVATNSAAFQASSKFIPVLSLSNGSVLRATLLSGVYITLLGLCGLGLGFILRSTAGAISLFVGVLLVLPIVVAMLPTSVSAHFNSFLPNNLGSAMMVVTLHHNAYGGIFLPPYQAMSILALYAAVLLGFGAWRLMRADA
jgi:hypothetical protein